VLKAFDDGAVDVAAMRAKGLTHAARFTWERCAQETLAVYERALGQK
jgi:glycosyltransferase involved in cell wall biosynthesis